MASLFASRPKPEDLFSAENVTLCLDLHERVGRLREELEAGLAEIKLDPPKSRWLRRARPLSLRTLARTFASFSTLRAALLATPATLTRGGDRVLVSGRASPRNMAWFIR